MKKFMTVLLVIAVMFTFSFGSAFAAIQWTGEETSKYLTEDTDYIAPGDTEDGKEGITEAYRTVLLDFADAEEDKVDDGTYDLYAPEEAEALKLIEKYREAVKVVKTAKEGLKLKTDLAADLAAIDTKTEVLAAAKALDVDTLIEMTRLVGRNTETTLYYLPGYGVVPVAKVAKDDTVDPAKFYFVSKTTTVDAVLESSQAVEMFVTEWLMDNDYRTAAELKEGAGAFVAALVPITEDYVKAVKDELADLNEEGYKYADKYDANHASNRLTAADLEAVDAVVAKMDAFEDKYAKLTLDNTGAALTLEIDDTDLETAVDDFLVTEHFDQYCTEVSAVPETKKLTDADKAGVIALYNKVNALEDAYDNVWGRFGGDTSAACNYNLLDDAYNYFLEEDVKAFENLEKFTAYETAVVGMDTRAYFDDSEKNVNALKAQREAFDALVANYGYADFIGEMGEADVIAAEALILAAEHNMPADVEYDVKDVTKLQNYLNNSTLKVTTKALGNKKIRVQARFDAETYKDIVAECGNDFAIKYQFHYKRAKAEDFKAGKVRDVNYSTFKLAKGVKYHFHCAILIVDAEGNTVATKDYKGSTLGVRTAK